MSKGNGLDIRHQNYIKKKTKNYYGELMTVSRGVISWDPILFFSRYACCQWQSSHKYILLIFIDLLFTTLCRFFFIPTHLNNKHCVRKALFDMYFNKFYNVIYYFSTLSDFFCIIQLNYSNHDFPILPGNFLFAIN